jgi:hypothetical protein
VEHVEKYMMSGFVREENADEDVFHDFDDEDDTMMNLVMLVMGT